MSARATSTLAPARPDLLTAGYAASFKQLIADAQNGAQVTTIVQNQLTRSFAGAAQTTQQDPHYARQIPSVGRSAFLHGAERAYTAGIIALLLGADVVYPFFPKKQREAELLAAYHAEDNGGSDVPAEPVARPQS